jgi:hypothetical protein
MNAVLLEIRAMAERVRRLRLKVEDGEIPYSVELEEAFRELNGEADEGLLTIYGAGKEVAS